MKTDLECIPCILRQTVNIINISGIDHKTGEKVVREVLKKLEKLDFGKSPAFNTDIGYHSFSKITGIEDPYRNIKKECNSEAIKLYPELEKIVSDSGDSLYAAAKIAVAGNVIDFGAHITAGEKLNLEKVIDEIIKIPLAHDDYRIFEEDLKGAEEILYLGDNAGEIVFDRVFINQIIKGEKRVIFSVKSGPIINDATLDDAREVRLDSLVKIIATGNNCIGINLQRSSREFMEQFENADIIISKGQGNFESLDEVKGKKIFFLLKAKCKKIARELGVDYMDIVFKRSKYYR